jgi:ABC-type transport auxiliary lipoprotein component
MPVRTVPCGFYDYHRWAADPRQFVTTAVVDGLRARGNFADVTVYEGRSHADYIITGRMEKLEEVDYQSGVKIDVALSAQMRDIRTGTTVDNLLRSEQGHARAA